MLSIWAVSEWGFSSKTRENLRLGVDMIPHSLYGHLPTPLDMHENNEADESSLHVLHVNTKVRVTQLCFWLGLVSTVIIGL